MAQKTDPTGGELSKNSVEGGVICPCRQEQLAVSRSSGRPWPQTFR